MVMAFLGVEHSFGAQFSVKRLPTSKKTAASWRASLTQMSTANRVKFEPEPCEPKSTPDPCLFTQFLISNA